jgi:p-aminobenzoyl-glutamate transporter AbgT
MCFSTVTVKKIRVDKNCAFQTKCATENALSFLVLNGVLCAQFMIAINNTNLGGTVPLAALFFLGNDMGFNTNTRGGTKVRFLIFFYESI